MSRREVYVVPPLGLNVVIEENRDVRGKPTNNRQSQDAMGNELAAREQRRDGKSRWRSRPALLDATPGGSGVSG
jgi:hypothetical protein